MRKTDSIMIVLGAESSKFNIGVFEPTYESDTWELAWDTSDAGREVITVNMSGSIAVIGFSGGRIFDFRTIRIESGDTLLNDLMIDEYAPHA
ncbi:MAG: hypothetical protein ACUVQ0_04660 [Thermoproteota archaeon]